MRMKITPDSEIEAVKEYLKKQFAEKWPDAAKAIKRSTSREHKNAACLWLGFKKGFDLGAEYVRGGEIL